ncbi:flagellar biosynthesis protein FlhB [Photobacterium sp. NCIMB 13483]|uniref:Flagellar biosynthetic protein FlhB n=1 Tax=Photobacterium piscicola TaxID=1378299 RepID=A0A1T5HZ94_9GAMM|nr:MULTISPECIES: EscU/YscU/HrcU family type III secretion system export apparatus switch protein [Photobacterium]MEC6821961.1 EscU/YscU/HrcU family type III secretion system export apparatus switch protein [Photobacterium piscicola]MEC6880854.1 EscU/YscU/HrcU family type III secretion system export apparatus switch protein [Photobacterium piscicola]PST94756.1 flagellar biosynthesis protein FlhB [Photobacterium sp. NCIMB 13483]SKC32147.1 flagellar biosynthesis protein FlhB [Photobacterium piscic
MTNKTTPNAQQAIALRYDGEQAPYVAAKGYDKLAQHIIEQVKQQGGLIHQDPILAQYLNSFDLNDHIPQELYLIIAELIAFSWYLNGKTPPGWEGFENIDITA